MMGAEPRIELDHGGFTALLSSGEVASLIMTHANTLASTLNADEVAVSQKHISFGGGRVAAAVIGKVDENAIGGM